MERINEGGKIMVELKTITLAIYGDFSKNDVRYKLFEGDSVEQYSFQNILINAGYNCKLTTISKEELEKLFKVKE